MSIFKEKNSSKQTLIQSKKFFYFNNILFVFGFVLLFLGVSTSVFAQSADDPTLSGLPAVMFSLDYGVCAIFAFVEGSVGALLTTVAGIVAIIAAGFGKYNLAYNMLIVGVACFILRAIISLFFGYYTCGPASFPGMHSPVLDDPTQIEEGLDDPIANPDDDWMLFE